MEQLSIFERLVDIDQRDQDAIQGTLRCTCGNDHFGIYFYGKRTKGILAPDIVRREGKICILAYCELCGISYGFDNFEQSRIQFNDESKITNELSVFDTQKHKVRLSFNYFPEKFKSNDFEYLRVELFQPIKNKWRVIAEE